MSEPINHSIAAKETESRKNTLWLDSVAGILEKAVYPISDKMKSLSLIILGLMVLPVVFDVLLRLFFKSSILGANEIEECAMVAVVYLAISCIQVKKEPISVELVVSRFPQWLQVVIQGFIYLISLVLFGLMSVQMIIATIENVETRSIVLHIPIFIFMGLASLGIIMLTIVLLIDCLRTFSQILKDGRGPWLLLVFTGGLLVFISSVLGRMFLGPQNGIVLGSLGMGILFLLILLRMPIAYAMALVGLLGMITVKGNLRAPFSMLGIVPYTSVASYILTVVPMFMLMGNIAFRAGISRDLFEAASKWLGRLPGGLAMSAVAACAGFAAVCGDSMATATTMGAVAFPELRRKNYADSLSAGCLAAGGTLGILIPPSMGFIMYALVTEESIGKLFVAGIVPGLLLASMFILAIWIIAVRNPAVAPRSEATPLREKIVSLKGIIGMLILFVTILGGIIRGYFSPTEAGAVGAFCAFILALFQRRLTRDNFILALNETVIAVGRLIPILVGVSILGYFLAASKLPFLLADFVTGFGINRYIIFAGVIVFYIILGCVLNIIPMILLTLPAIFPTILALGFDPVWFGVVIVITMEMGQITPPVGMNVFAMKSVARDVALETMFKGILPFFICMILIIVILTIFPGLALFLPNLFF
ncbi:TRAP transporter large permease subunit [Moorella sulfitireducens (nom. illeg.)]|uniref:TRAP transporter large permease n=1 Tax=Neomoorella sulfitireducens TaxID=2972948 RepID=UPI0021AD1FFE|nr:TRAP transporter large permease subunit [Moorella sulfitireducens]